MSKDKQKIGLIKLYFMDYFHSMRIMELSGIHPAFGIPTSIMPQFPPGVSPPALGLLDQKKLKEKFFKDNASINSKLQDFNQMYQKFASGLFEIAYPALPPGHPLFSRLESTITLQNENEKLKKENLDLKKQLSKDKKTEPKL